MKVFIHKSNNGEWIWTIQAENNRIVGRSSESYHNQHDAVTNFEQVTGRSVKGFGVVLDRFENKANATAIFLNETWNPWEVRIEW